MMNFLRVLLSFSSQALPCVAVCRAWAGRSPGGLPLSLSLGPPPSSHPQPCLVLMSLAPPRVRLFMGE